MNKLGPIIIIDDDKDDQELFVKTLKSLECENEVVCFENGKAAINYLDSSRVKPFLILSDINLHRSGGYEIKQRIRQHGAPHVHCVPYLFFTTGSLDTAVCNAYQDSVQGFFVKPYSIGELEATLKNIVVYWQSCTAPRYDR